MINNQKLKIDNSNTSSFDLIDVNFSSNLSIGQQYQITLDIDPSLLKNGDDFDILGSNNGQTMFSNNYYSTSAPSGKYTYNFTALATTPLKLEITIHWGGSNASSAITFDNISLSSVSPPSNSVANYFTPDIISSTDYYPFGAPMNGRNYTSSSTYRYGFNGKEFDQETGTQDYGMRIYNPNLGKFLSVDPLQKKFAWNSSYAFAENDVIRSSDLDGLEKNFQVQYKDKSGTLLWHTVPYIKMHPGQVYGPLGKGDYVYTKDVKTGQSVGKYNETYEEAHPIRSALQSADQHYQGEQGFKNLGEDLSSSSTYIKAGGAITVGIGVVTLQPEIVAGGVALYEVGGNVDIAGTAIQVTSDINDATKGKEGSGTKATIKALAAVTGAVVSKATNGMVGSEANKAGTNMAADLIIDKVKEEGIKSTETTTKEK